MPDLYVLKLRNGTEIRAGSEQELRAKHFCHELMSVSEGICPSRGIPLERLPDGLVKAGYIAGRCRPCYGYHWVTVGRTPEETRAGWSRAAEPHTGERLTDHEWMA